MKKKKTEAAPKLTQGEYTASDVRKTAGLSYRQINNWNSKGALPGEREGKEGWNKFTARDIFALAVSAEIRRQFLVPLESVKWLQTYMQQGQVDHFYAAVELIGTTGFTVWLLTDCKTTFIMDSDLLFKSMFDWGFFRDDGPNGYIFLKINPIVNKILGCLKDPMELKSHNRTYTAISEATKPLSIQNLREAEILELIRNRGYDRINVKLKNGTILSAEGEEEISVTDQKRFLQIIKQHKYQTVTIKSHDGKIVRLNRKISHKFSDTKKILPLHRRQKKPEEGSEE